MVTRTPDLMTFTLKGANSLDVELTLAVLAEALGNRLSVTRRGPGRDGVGVSLSGVVLGYGIGDPILPEPKPKASRRKRHGLPKTVV